MQWGLLACFGAYLAGVAFVRIDSFEHHLRMYRADLSNPSRLVSLHIVLCSGMLFMAAVLMAVFAALGGREPGASRLRKLAEIEAFLFILLAVDIRFALAPALGLPWFHAIHAGVLLAQAVVLVQFRDLLVGRAALVVAAGIGLASSAVVPVFDLFIAEDERWHLWLEEGTRAVSCLAWIYFAWTLFAHRVRSDPQVAIAKNSATGRIVWALAGSIGALVVAGAFVAITPLVTKHDRIFGTIPLFHLDAEWTIPAFFSTMMLVAASALAAALACFARANGSRWRMRWAILSGGFFYMAVDESISLHETIGDPIHALLPLKGTIFEYAWVVAAIPLVIVLAVYFLPMLWNMPKADRNRLILAGVVYLGGAIGAETLSGSTDVYIGNDTILYQLTVILEEGMEMAGLGLLIRTLILMLPLSPPRLSGEMSRPTGELARA
ncbi:MAG: hypothetical protein ACREIA_17310 [Opitutaceae bacterium]